MNLFYLPGIGSGTVELDAEQSRHCARSLRLRSGDEIWVTDGRGNMARCRIVESDPSKCTAEIIEMSAGYGKRSYSLHMAVAPTKNIDRYEWFVEKATEIGCDRITPLRCHHSERKAVKTERLNKIVLSAMKQSLSGYCPSIDEMTGFKELISQNYNCAKFIAHCDNPVKARNLLKEMVVPGQDILILIGPEGDFSPSEINFAVENGFREISLGRSRLRTETAAIVAVDTVSIFNQ